MGSIPWLLTVGRLDLIGGDFNRKPFSDSPRGRPSPVYYYHSMDIRNPGRTNPAKGPAMGTSTIKYDKFYDYFVSSQLHVDPPPLFDANHQTHPANTRPIKAPVYLTPDYSFEDANFAVRALREAVRVGNRYNQDLVIPVVAMNVVNAAMASLAVTFPIHIRDVPTAFNVPAVGGFSAESYIALGVVARSTAIAIASYKIIQALYQNQPQWPGLNELHDDVLAANLLCFSSACAVQAIGLHLPHNLGETASWIIDDAFQNNIANKQGLAAALVALLGSPNPRGIARMQRALYPGEFTHAQANLNHWSPLLESRLPIPEQLAAAILGDGWANPGVDQNEIIRILDEPHLVPIPVDLHNALRVLGNPPNTAATDGRIPIPYPLFTEAIRRINLEKDARLAGAVEGAIPHKSIFTVLVGLMQQVNQGNFAPGQPHLQDHRIQNLADPMRLTLVGGPPLNTNVGQIGRQKAQDVLGLRGLSGVVRESGNEIVGALNGFAGGGQPINLDDSIIECAIASLDAATFVAKSAVMAAQALNTPISPELFLAANSVGLAITGSDHRGVGIIIN